MRGDIVNFSQTLNYVLLNATKPGSEAHDTRQFTKQYHKRLEDINRYESENGQGTINDHVKIATVVNTLKGNIAQNMMMKITDDFRRGTSMDFPFLQQHVHWQSGTDEDNRGTVGGVNNYEEENYNDENYEEEYNEN
eukprot:437215-Amphidinium_carterae.2